MFGSFSASADAPVLSVPYQKGQTVTYSGPAINKTWTPSSDNPPIPAMEQLLNWLGWDDQYQPARTPGDWTVTPIMDTYNPYTEKIVPLKGDKDGNPVVTPGAGFPANAITATGTSATINLPTGSSYTVINTKKVPLKP